MLRDNRGVTLMELLAGVTVSFFVLAVAFALFMSMHHTVETGTQRYLDQSAAGATLNRLAAELSDATAVVHFAALGELRYTTGSVVRALVFDPGAKTLTLYEFSEGQPPAVKLANMADPTISLAEDPELYAKPRALPAVVTAVAFADEQGNPLSGTPLGEGALIRISVTFEYYEVKMNGTRVPVTRTAETTVKLFHDEV